MTVSSALRKAKTIAYGYTRLYIISEITFFGSVTDSQTDISTRRKRMGKPPNQMYDL